MLEDRSYMRRPRFNSYRSATVLLVIMNVVAFIVQLCISSFSHFPINHYFALSLAGLRHGYIWQLLTFQLMHAGWFHLIFNCLVIYMMGREVEEALGRRSFYTLYFCSGVIGGALQVLAGLVNPARFGGGVMGASAGGFGLIAAFAMLYPERPLTILISFIIPVTMRAKFLLLFAAVFAGIGILFLSDGVAHVAHLGGILAGMGFIRYAIHWNWPSLRRNSRQTPRRLVKVHSQKSGGWTQTKADIEDLPPEEFLSREVDPILDKITAQGIQSLTERERKILEAARKKMAKR